MNRNSISDERSFYRTLDALLHKGTSLCIPSTFLCKRAEKFPPETQSERGWKSAAVKQFGTRDKKTLILSHYEFITPGKKLIIEIH